jgi:gluconolactonase
MRSTPARRARCCPDPLTTSGLEQRRPRAVGYNGVTVWSPDAKLLGRIRIPQVCGNVCFGGPKRNRLFMAGSQSLYAVYTATQGAAPG